jgi:hypothetical protein
VVREFFRLESGCNLEGDVGLKTCEVKAYRQKMGETVKLLFETTQICAEGDELVVLCEPDT